jgi:hypothetical protein
MTHRNGLSDRGAHGGDHHRGRGRGALGAAEPCEGGPPVTAPPTVRSRVARSGEPQFGDGLVDLADDELGFGGAAAQPGQPVSGGRTPRRGGSRHGQGRPGTRTRYQRTDPRRVPAPSRRSQRVARDPVALPPVRPNLPRRTARRTPSQNSGRTLTDNADIRALIFATAKTTARSIAITSGSAIS